MNSNSGNSSNPSNKIDNKADEKASKPPTGKHLLKDPLFYTAYMAAVAVLYVASIPHLRSFSDENWWAQITLWLCIPAILAGVVIWAIVKRRNMSIAMGILFGSQTPFYIVCILTGGCGLYTYWT